MRLFSSYEIIVSLIALLVLSAVGRWSHKEHVPRERESERRPRQGRPTTQIIITNSEPYFADLMDHINSGRKVEAIKLIRKERKLALLEAKRFVEHLESWSRNREENTTQNGQ
jgi:ribosomal protein L7/L12